jgi:uncharacterized cupredoxin-like copper-binding protein
MKRFQVLACTLLLLCTMVALSACGGENSSGKNDSNASNSGASSSASGNASTPASGANGSTNGNTSGPKVVRIVMGEMYFKPEMTTFKVGQPYQFLLVNEGKMEHEFTIAPPRKAGQTEKDEDAVSLLDTDNLKAGETRSVDFTFKEPAPADKLEFECSYPNHYEMGMHTSIVVEP